MLIDTLVESQVYMKATLIECLSEAKGQTGLPIASSYKTIMRREKQGVTHYTQPRRDPVNGWRFYTGHEIRQIVTFETELAKSKLKKQSGDE